MFDMCKEITDRIENSRRVHESHLRNKQIENVQLDTTITKIKKSKTGLKAG